MGGSSEPLPIAVIGIGCRFPGGANDPEALWSLLSEGRDAWSEVPEDRFHWESFHDSHPEAQGCMNHRGGHFLQQDVAAFDADFFGIPPAEAKAIDPQQRLLLETTYEAVEDSGLPLEAFRGSDAAVFAASFANDYERMLSKDMGDLSRYHIVGTGIATFANRISHVFDLKGPSVTIDTGCSGSLVALHQACQSLRNYESSVALAGGAVLILSPDLMIAMSQQHILNDDGRCYSFDSRGSGYGRGEGATMLLLKRLDDALQAHLPIRAIIRSTAVNQDGRTNGLTLPNQAAQESLARSALRNLNFTPSDVQYVEAHGTGTVAGDVAEFAAIRGVYCDQRDPTRPLILGSIKPNIGHLEPASGLAGLIKTILCMEKGYIPPNLLLENPKTGIPLEETKIHLMCNEIPRVMTKWPCPDKPKRAAVNNFGYGGTNATVILEEFSGFDPRRPVVSATKELPLQPQDSHWKMFPFSAKSSASLTGYLEDMQGRLRAQPQLDVCGTPGDLSRRPNHSFRRGIVAYNAASLIEGIGNGSHRQCNERRRTIYVFTGQGAQWHGMGLDLTSYAVFSESLRRSEDFLVDIGASWRLMEELNRCEISTRVHESAISQPATIALQIALVDLLRSLDILPDAVVGHSSGEIAAAYAARMLSQKDSLVLAYFRGLSSGKGRNPMVSSGGMLAVGLGSEEAEKCIAKLGLSDHVAVACMNSPTSSTISGTVDAIAKVQAALNAEDVFTRTLKIDTAYHSKLMGGVASLYRPYTLSVTHEYADPSVRFYSTVTGKRLTARLEPEYWITNLVSPVQFSAGVKSILDDLGSEGHLDFVEIGPHSALAGYTKELINGLRQQKPVAFSYNSALKRHQNSVKTFLETVASLFESGAKVRTSSLTTVGVRHPSSIKPPPYHWDRSKRYWLEPRLSQDDRNRSSAPHELLGLRILTSPDSEPSWRCLIGVDSLPWLADHIIDGVVVFPATAYLSMATEALKQLRGDADHAFTEFRFRKVTFMRVLHIPSSPEKVEIILNIRKTTKPWWMFRIFSTSNGQWYEHCNGQITVPSTPTQSEGGVRPEHPIWLFKDMKTLEEIKSSCIESFQGKRFYTSMRDLGNDYGRSFARIQEVHFSNTSAMARIVLPDSELSTSPTSASRYTIHPALFDSFLQLAVFLFLRSSRLRSAVPIALEQIRVAKNIRKDSESEVLVTCEIRETQYRSTLFHIIAYQTDEAGVYRPVVQFHAGALRATGEAKESGLVEVKDAVFRMRWSLDTRSLTSEDLEALPRSTLLEVKLQEEKLDRLVNAANIFISNAKKELQQLNRVVVSDHRAHVFKNIMRHHVESESRTYTSSERLAEDLSSLGVEGELLARIGPVLPSILSGEADALSLLLEDDLLYRVYREDSSSRCSTYLTEYVGCLVFKNPNMRILEVGAGTGGSTLPLLSTLSPTGRSICKSYDFTDISPGFFEQARSTLEKWQDMVTMAPLDIAKDPTEQGFQPHSYDLIIASNVLHATPNVSKTLSNVYRLLKPGGILALTELTASNAMYDMTFGLLPGWWAGNEDGRTSGPLLSENQWDRRLRECSFTGVGIAAFDFPGTSRRMAFLVSQARPSSIPNGYHVYCVKVIDFRPGAPGSDIFITCLFEQLLQRGYQPEISSCHETIDSSCSYVVLESQFWPILASCKSEQFDFLRDLATIGLELFWITLPGQGVTAPSFGASLVTGFARTARSENEALRFVTIDVQDDLEHRLDLICTLSADLITSFHGGNPPVDHTDSEFKIVNYKLLIPRIVKDDRLESTLAMLEHPSEKSVPFHSPEMPLMLRNDTPGILNNLKFAERGDFNKIGPDEVEIEVYACGVNNKDLWVALNQVKAKDDFVGECAGTIIGVGTNFQKAFKKGDRVCAMTATPYAAIARANAHVVCIIPDLMSFTTAVSIPIAFCTALYSLCNIAHLSLGQKVLIHSGSSTLGQAAIQIAKHIGAEVFTTTSSPSGNTLLCGEYGLLSDHVLKSDPAILRDTILQMTDDQGVDVALNSSSGEMLHATWECMGEMGTFVDVRQQDMPESAQLDMEQFDKSVTFSSVDMILLSRRRPKLVQDLLGRVFSMFDEVLHPVHPVTVMPISQVQQALRTVQAGEYTGKIVLDAGPEARVSAAIRTLQPLRLSSDGTYAIVGGLGNLGRRMCHHLAALGAGHIVLLTRQHLVREHVENELGQTKAYVMHCDITKLGDVQSVAAQIARRLPPLKGIIHAPLVLRDKVLSQMTVDDFSAAANPKYLGTVNLMQVFGDYNLDFFMFGSSLSGIIGNPGQANYAAGNTYQDGIAQHKPVANWNRCISLDMAVLSDTNVVSREQEAKLSKRGMRSISNDAILPFLEYTMSSDLGKTSEQILVGMDINSASYQNRILYSKNAMFSHLFTLNQEMVNSSQTPMASKSALEQLKSMQINESPSGLQELMVSALTEKLASLVALNLDNIKTTIPIANLGLDSLIAIELKNWISKALHTPVQTSEILDSLSIEALAKLLHARIQDAIVASQARQFRKSKDDSIEVIEETRDTPSAESQNTKPPDLPLQPLRTTLDTFYNSVRSLGTKEELCATRKSIADMCQSDTVGPILQSRLASRAEDKSLGNWMSEIYNNNFWLQRRAPLRPAMNFFASHVLTARQYKQAEKAALLSLAAFDFKIKLERGDIQPDIVNDEPQCMESLNWIFNACRRPGTSCDSALRFPGNDFIVAMRNGHVYKIPLLDANGGSVSRAKLTNSFDEILQTAPKDICWASVLTAGERTQWGTTFTELLEVDEHNRECISAIEAALFIICLDDGAPETSEERVSHFLLDDNRNRWNDKTLSLIVCENGVSAFWCEHSMIDGTTLDQLCHSINRALIEDGEQPDVDSVVVGERQDYSFHSFILSPRVEEQIISVSQDYQASILGIDFTTIDVSFGEHYLREHKLAPKGALQAIISLAVCTHFGYSPASYEAVSLRSFFLGRMDIYQVHTAEMDAFVSTAASPNSVPETKLLSLLRLAVSAHAAGIANASRGRGWDRHLCALRAVLQPGEDEPALFRDALYTKTRPRKVFVSFSAMGIPEWGSVWRDREALWIGVEMLVDRCKLCVYNGLGKAGEFGVLVKEAADFVRGVVDGTAAESVALVAKTANVVV
ncbi:hypothetical protein P154DRAFT_610722 [Amniculicola lignicola CBS 123094]|uniref:Uncharacterized protein n=1 Tax=Amniculicola lignicola CBS 123094 TaxID=1392246 RepID=A0A6A5W3Q1_9PLEO|nr:hypothetical protein P154DRAFT_610722 [Amniculicola lignicola CBS 123094]